MMMLAMLLLADVPACPAQAAPPSGLDAWTARTAVGGAAVKVGEAVDVALHPADQVRFAAAPERTPAAGSLGAAVSLDVAQPGTYRIALGAPAWLDVIEDGRRVVSSAHSHGPFCTGIRKLIDFPLKAGPHVVQISGTTEPRAGLLVTKLP